MPKFVIETKRDSIFEPIEFEIDGKVFRVREPIDNKLLAEVAKFERDALNGDSEALINQFCALTTAENDLVKKIDIRVLSEALRFFVDSIQFPVKKEDGEKKNVKPGDSKSVK